MAPFHGFSICQVHLQMLHHSATCIQCLASLMHRHHVFAFHVICILMLRPSLQEPQEHASSVFGMQGQTRQQASSRR